MGFLIFLATIGIICVCCQKSKGFSTFIKIIVAIILIFIIGLLLVDTFGVFY